MEWRWGNNNSILILRVNYPFKTSSRVLICSVMWSSQKENFIAVCSHCSNPRNDIFHLVLSRPKGRAVSCQDIFPWQKMLKQITSSWQGFPQRWKGLWGHLEGRYNQVNGIRYWESTKIRRVWERDWDSSGLNEALIKTTLSSYSELFWTTNKHQA